MEKVKFRTKWIVPLLTGILILSGCSGSHSSENMQIRAENEKNEEAEIMKELPEKFEEISAEESAEKSEETSLEEPPEKPEKISPEESSEKPEVTVISADWSEYFDGLNGAAVMYDASKEQYMIYNSELAETRRSPCSPMFYF